MLIITITYSYVKVNSIKMDYRTTCESELETGRISLNSPVKVNHTFILATIDETKMAYRKRRGAFDSIYSKITPSHKVSLEIIQKERIERVTEVFDFVTPKKDFCPMSRPKSRR